MSLSDQLKRLQIPGQAVIQQYSSAKHSILFDSQTSATLDNETILEIGVTGFTALCSIDPVFKQFEDLFSRSALQIQRNMESKEFNQKLSKKLASFLIFLSPYILLKPSHRALEWLVRRFQIHIHDKSSLMACILPYHETQFFGRIVQLFGELQSDQLWVFLQPCRQTGIGFSTNTLVQHCLKNESILRFVHDMTIHSAELLKQNPKSGLHIIFSFHARLFISVIDSKSKIKEKFLTFIITLITSGLKSSYKDPLCSLYMIVGLLSLKVFLKGDVTKSLFRAVVQSLQTGWYEEGLLCVLSLVVHQKLEKISSGILKLFIGLDLTRLVQVLNGLNKEHDIEVLINLLIPGMSKSCFSCVGDEGRFIQLLHLMIDNQILVERHIKIVGRKFISTLLSSEDQRKDIQKVQSLLRIMAKRFSAVFDEIIALFFKESNGNQKCIEVIKQLSMFCLSRHKVVESVELPIVLGLNHPESSIRADAVSQLLKNFESIDYEDDEIEFMKDAILARLKDDSIDVVNSVLKYPKSLSKILSGNDLQDLCISLMNKTDHHVNSEIIIITIERVGVKLYESKFIYSLLNHLFYELAGTKNTTILGYFQTNNIKSNNPILIGIQKALANDESQKLNCKSCIAIYHNLISSIAREISESTDGMNVILNFWEFCKVLQPYHDLQFVIILLFNEILSCKMKSFVEGFVTKALQMSFKNFLKMDLNEEFLSALKSFENCDEENTYLYKSFYTHVRQNKSVQDFFPLSFLVFCKNLIAVVPKGHNTEALFNLLATQSGNKEASLQRFFQLILNQFLKQKFISKNELLSFLCDVCLNALKEDVKEEMLKSTLCALHIMTNILTKDDYDLIVKNRVIQVSHALFLCKHPKVRQVVLQTTIVLYDIFKEEKKDPWNNVLLKVLESKKELTMDSLYIKRIFQTLFYSKKMNDFASLIKKTSFKPTVNFITKNLITYPSILQLNILKVLENVNSKDCIEDYLNVLSMVLKTEELTDCQVEIIKCILSHIKPKLINENKNILTLFCKCLSTSNELLQNVTCEMVSENFYSQLSSENRRMLLKELFQITLSSAKLSTVTKMRVILKSININASDIHELLEKFCHDFDQQKMTNFIGDSFDTFTKSLSWRQLVELLESVSCKKKFDQPEILITPLFNILSRCLLIKDASVEFVKQLILTIFVCILEQGVLSISPDLFKIDLIIQCLQETSDFQTTQHCLILLGKSSQHYPSQVLHNIMHIFTFMGGTMLKIDNEHTFRLIENTIDAIVPMLVQKPADVAESRKRASPANIDGIVLFILETFIDSAPHCPEHRRQHIFSHLIKVLNESYTLHTAMVLLIKKTVQHAQELEVVADDNFKEMQAASITLDFCKDFFMVYPSNIQLNALHQIIAYLKAPNEEEKVKKSKNGNKQLKLLTYAVIKFVTEVLASDNMQELYDEENCKSTPFVIKLLEELLSYAEALSKKNHETQRDKKYLNNLVQKVYDAVGLLYKILPFDPFVMVISGLMHKESLLIRKKSLEMLCTKLLEVETLQKEQEKPLLDLYSTIVLLVQHKSDDLESPVNKQLMLYAMKLLAVHLCMKNKEIFLKSVPIITQIYSLETTNNLVAVNAILCVAEFSSHLKAAMLPYLSIFFKPILEKIKMEGEYQSNDLTLIGCTTAVQKIIGSMAEFMSPFVPKILETISIAEHLAEKLSCSQLMVKVNDLKEHCGNLISPRVLFPAIQSWFIENIISNKNLVSSIIDVLRHSFAVISKSDANTNFQGTILKILKVLLNVRSSDISCDEVVSLIIEKKSIAAYCELVLKLSENTLRPMYLEIYSWACEDMGRLCTFFRLAVELSKTLKSLFLIFFGHTMKKCTELLVTLNTKSTGSNANNLKNDKELLTAILDVLSNVFKYDNQGFVNKERFESIMQPLVDQLENQLFTDDAFTLFVGEHLLPCLVNFASAVNDSTCWKPLNHQILLKTKNSQPNIRLAALQVIENIYSRMGESYMILVPETIPFLAEVLEDDSFEVEEQCQKVIKQIETITGESLQKYF